jgi:hypothetical protein
MKPVDLNDIVPRTGSFELDVRGDRRTLHLRPVNLLDETWLEQTFGERASRIFTEASFYEMARIAFHQMLPEDQLLFKKQPVTIVDESGVEDKREIGGVELLATMLTKKSDKRLMTLAVIETIGVSRPAVDMAKEAIKKKAALAVATNEQTGATPSTSSAPSMDGQPSTSSAEQPERLPGDLSA